MLTAAVAHQYADDPLLFCRFHWPDMLLYPKQIEMLLSIRDNYITLVHAGHKLGKDRTAAIATLWFFSTRTPARVIMSSSSQTQLRDTLWPEVRNLAQMAEDNSRPLPVYVQTLQAQKPIAGKPGQFYPLDYIRGKVAMKGESFHGHHLDGSAGPAVLIILSEASAIDDMHYESSQTQAHRILCTGNPVTTEGFFAKECLAGNLASPTGKGLFRNVIHIDGERDSPNVIVGRRWKAERRPGDPPTVIPGVLNYQEYLQRLEWPRDVQDVRLRGLFPQHDAEKLFAMNDLDTAQRAHAAITRLRLQYARTRKGRTMPWTLGPISIGVDSGQGEDCTVHTVADLLGVVEKRRKKTPVTSEIVSTTRELAKAWGAEPGAILFDAGGGGRQHADTMRDKGWDVRDVGFGERSNQPTAFKNLRAEMYGGLAASMQASIGQEIIERDAAGDLTPRTVERILAGASQKRYFAFSGEDARLREDCAVLPKRRDDEGRLCLPPKDRKHARHGTHEKTIREMLGRSPDDGDSAVLACYAHGYALGIAAAESLDNVTLIH